MITKKGRNTTNAPIKCFNQGIHEVGYEKDYYYTDLFYIYKVSGSTWGIDSNRLQEVYNSWQKKLIHILPFL